MLIGSFLNVVIYRFPIMKDRAWQAEARAILELPEPEQPEPPFNLVLPASTCPHCGHRIRAWENIPLLSYLWLRGRCSNCGAGISIRYPTIEVATGLLTMLTIQLLGFGTAGLLAVILIWVLIAASMIDFDTMYLWDEFTLPLLWLGLIANYYSAFVSLEDAVIGAMVGYLSLWSVFHVFKLLTGKEGFGYGDFKLLAALGAWMGWQAIPLIIILSSFVGAVVGGGLIMFGRDRSKPIPFGPYLAIAGIIALLWGDAITGAYLQYISQ
ncbi:MAG: A24 family peptidase [Pseudomonadota bacterium]